MSSSRSTYRYLPAAARVGRRYTEACHVTRVVCVGRGSHPEACQLRGPHTAGVMTMCKYVVDRWEREAEQTELYKERWNRSCEGGEGLPE